jgi:hypothetical protein
MNRRFFKFPHTPHLVWLGKKPPREDKVLSEEEAQAFLKGEVVVEEKVDGAIVSLSLDEEGRMRVQGRGEYLGRGEHPQFDPLWPWMESRRPSLTKALRPGLVLSGEWCFAVHSVRYARLPDWLLGFDVYDPGQDRFWSTERRDRLLGEIGIARVPEIARGRCTIESLCRLLGTSRVGVEPMEGLYVRREHGNWLDCRAKIVRPEFAQSIEEHWALRPLEKNSLAQHGHRTAIAEKRC